MVEMYLQTIDCSRHENRCKHVNLVWIKINESYGYVHCTGWDNILALWEPMGCGGYFGQNCAKKMYDNDKNHIIIILS